MERVAHIFLHNVGIGKLFVLCVEDFIIDYD